jgi:hypothetical protein
MDLFQRNKIEIACANGGLKEAAILEDIFAGVPFHEAEIEDFFGFERTHSAGSSAEAVQKPGKLAEWDEFENLQSAGLTEPPWRRNARFRRRRGRRVARATTLQGSFSGSHNQTSIIASA